MTPSEAKIAIVTLLKDIQSQGIDIDITSDYGADNRIDLATIPWSGWENTEAVRWGDLNA